MIFRNIVYLTILLSFVMSKTQAQSSAVELSSTLIEKILKEVDYQKELKALDEVNMEDLIAELDSDEEKFVFWINVYNSFIIHHLRTSPSLYENRGAFFKKSLIQVASKDLSFSFVEHSILRRSAHELLLGYFTNPFASKLEKKLRVDERDFRLHFALNCGANDCPPVRVYTLESLGRILEENTSQYLYKFTKIDIDKKTIHTTPLFSWFRGDFGGKCGVKKILVKYNIIDEKYRKWSLNFTDYDWTINLDNYIL